MKNVAGKVVVSATLLLALVLAGSVSAASFAVFRLLDLDGAFVRWGASTAPTVVTYAVVGDDHWTAGARNCKGIRPVDDLLQRSGIERPAFEGELEAAFAMWETATNIAFRRVSDPAAAGIVIGAQIEPAGHAFANVQYLPGDGRVREIDRSLICLNPAKRWKVGFDGDLDVYDLRYTLAHEIGHAIGLDHPDAPEQLMSFTYREAFRELQRGDIAGAVAIYGDRRIPAAVAPARTVPAAFEERGVVQLSRKARDMTSPSGFRK